MPGGRCVSAGEVLDDVHDDAGARIHEHNIRADPDPDVTLGEPRQVHLQLVRQAFALESGWKLSPALDLLLKPRRQRGPLGQARGERTTRIVFVDQPTITIGEDDLNPPTFVLHDDCAGCRAPGQGTDKSHEHQPSENDCDRILPHLDLPLRTPR